MGHKRVPDIRSTDFHEQAVTTYFDSFTYLTVQYQEDCATISAGLVETGAVIIFRTRDDHGITARTRE